MNNFTYASEKVPKELALLQSVIDMLSRVEEMEKQVDRIQDLMDALRNNLTSSSNKMEGPKNTGQEPVPGLHAALGRLAFRLAALEASFN